jgi:Effector Associated Constant Component 1
VAEDTGTVHLTVSASSRAYGPHDDAFIEQVEALWRSLRERGIYILDEDTAGSKGSLVSPDTVQVVVAGGAGLSALVGFLSLWVKQRGHREIRLTRRMPGEEERSVEITTENVSDDALTALAKSIIDSLQ